MTLTSAGPSSPINQLIEVLARKVFIPRERILPFVDYSEFLSELLTGLLPDRSRLIVIGHTEPWVQTPIRKTGIATSNCYGPSPFRLPCPDQQAERLTGDEILWIANPNPITGAGYSLADLRIFARSLPMGTLVIDEGLFDFYGISSLSLMAEHANIIVLRSLTLGFGEELPRFGFAVVGEGQLVRPRREYSQEAVHKMSAALVDSDVLSLRLKSIRDEASRMIDALQQQNIEVRYSGTDSLLLEVSAPENLVLLLSEHGVEVENLSRHEGLSGYIKYRIRQLSDNARFVRRLLKTSPDVLNTESRSRTKLTLRKPEETIVGGSSADRYQQRDRAESGFGVVQKKERVKHSKAG